MKYPQARFTRKKKKKMKKINKVFLFYLRDFRDLRPTSLEKGQELKRLRFYAAYAWGGPLVVAGLAAILDHLPQANESSNILRPHFGEKQCWFIGKPFVFHFYLSFLEVIFISENYIFYISVIKLLIRLVIVE